MSFVKVFDAKGNQKNPQLFQELKLQLKNSQTHTEQDMIIHKIVDLTLRSRILCRSYQGKILDGIHLELYSQVKEFLIAEIWHKFKHKQSVQGLTLEIVSQLQTQCFQSSLDDQTLKQIALYAQKQTDDVALRSHCLSELVKAIFLSKRLCKPHQGLFNSNFYRLIYDQAVGETMTYISMNIDKYDPNRNSGKFMSWVNFKLNKLFFDCRREFDHSSVFDCLPLPDFDMIPYQPREMTLGEQLYQCIRKDSKKQFQKTYLPSNPQITFQQIALKRLSGLTWEDIAKDLDSNPSTLIAFYRRNCKKFREVLDQEIDI